MTARPFLTRLLVPFAVMIVLIVATAGSVAYWVGERTAYQQQVRDLLAFANLVREWVGPALAGGTGVLPEVETRLRRAAAAVDSRITVIDGDGRVQFDSHASPAAMDNHNGRPEVVTARTSGRGDGDSRRYSDTVHEDAVYVATLLDPAQPGGWVVRVSHLRHVWVDFGTPMWVILTASVAAALLVILLFGRLLQRQWIGPTQDLARAAERLAAGEWGARVDPSGADDLRFFSAKLNKVATHAQRQLADLREQRGDLQALVDTLPDPILVADAQSKLVLINAPAARMLDLTPLQAVGKRLVAVVNEQEILDLFDSINACPEPGVTDADGQPAGARLTRDVRMTRNGQRLTYQAFAARTPAKGTLIVLRDVSQLAGAVQMKTDFVANASHELRTPIAAIKIAFETLQDVYRDDPNQTERCVRIIEEHLRRLEEMLRDLLDLSRVENADLQPELVEVKTENLFAFIRGTLAPQARQKLVELRLERGDATPDTFQSDERLLNLVLKNLVENSVKFTPPGGSVTVCVEDVAAATGDGVAGVAGDMVRVTVADTGIGIPQEHVERVFERFYQVDAARSGSAGRGTGLGLAIVKHAVAALGGSVSIGSQVGVGTTVTCTFPARVATP
ncbi:MAG TPA: ATP-binding protein, partial [Tepidisphaeraceae bacterium]|nr:ATP-binding protein [Tepidisphaeraceae bacterium]